MAGLLDCAGRSAPAGHACIDGFFVDLGAIQLTQAEPFGNAGTDSSMSTSALEISRSTRSRSSSLLRFAATERRFRSR